MRAVILAAGMGSRLGEQTCGPKALLRVAGQTLLERHLQLLERVGVGPVAIVAGFEQPKLDRELDRLDTLSHVLARPTLLHNARYTRGSIVSLWCARQWLLDADDGVLVMDGDVLYPQEMLDALARRCDPRKIGVLMDRNVRAEDHEAVKICLANGHLVDMTKRPSSPERFDCVGESVGLFRLPPPAARAVTAEIGLRVMHDALDEPFEWALRDVLRRTSVPIEIHDVTGMPWIEIDFPDDLRRARDVIMPRIADGPPFRAPARPKVARAADVIATGATLDRIAR